MKLVLARGVSGRTKHFHLSVNEVIESRRGRVGSLGDLSLDQNGPLAGPCHESGNEIHKKIPGPTDITTNEK